VVRDHVAAHGPAEALFCFSDEGAIGAYRGLRDLGLRVPDDVALVGCNGDLDTEYLDVPISTLVCPGEEMCAQAWQFLQQRMSHPDLPRQAALLLPKLEIRESSGGGGGGRRTENGGGGAHSAPATEE
jgi:DNA-binding LacI/PurR family transcriptional regulator